MKKIISLLLVIYSLNIYAQSSLSCTINTLKAEYISGQKVYAYECNYSDTIAKQDDCMIYYDDVNLTDSILSPIILAKKEVNMSIKREVASDISLKLDSVYIQIYVWEGTINLITHGNYKGAFDFTLYVEKDDATYFGRYQGDKLLYYFYVHNK